MNMEISKEAKLAIANRAQVKARARLVHDGCHTDAAMRRRLLALVTERNLPPAEYAKLLHERIMMKSIHEFCSKHEVQFRLADIRRSQGPAPDEAVAGHGEQKSPAIRITRQSPARQRASVRWAGPLQNP